MRGELMKSSYQILSVCAVIMTTALFVPKTAWGACPAGQLEWNYWYGGQSHQTCGCTTVNADLDAVTKKPIPWIVDKPAQVYFSGAGTYTYGTGCVTTPWFYAANDGSVNGIANGFTTTATVPPIFGYTKLADTKSWCATQTVPVYVAGGKLNTTWKNCSAADLTVGTSLPAMTAQPSRTTATQVNAMPSCNGALPVDANKCHVYTCNTSTNYYQLVEKTCAAKDMICDSTTGGCISNCKTYSGPGTYIVKPCDKVVGTHFTIIFDSIYNTSTPQLSPVPDVTARIQYNWDGSLVQELVKTGAWNSVGLTKKSLNLYSRLGIGGGFADYEAAPGYNSNVPTIQLTMYPDCSNLYNQCAAQQITKLPDHMTCDTICPADANLPQFSYAATENLRISAPKDYSIVANLLAANAQNCYNKMAVIFGMKSVYPLHISINTKSKGDGCFGADSMDKLPCDVLPAYADSSISSLPGYPKYIADLAAGKCLESMSDKFRPTPSIPHELAHNYAINTFIAMNSEGLATLIEREITDANPEFIQLKFLCLSFGTQAIDADTGKYYGYGQPYGPLYAGNYSGGSCFFSDIKKIYGDKKFQQLFETVRKLPYGKSVHLFKDIVNPSVGEDVFPELGEKYELTSDPEWMSLSDIQFFFSN